MDKCDCEQSKTTMRSEDEKKKIKSHLHRLEGQIRAINTMIDNDRYCDDILIQLSAIDKSIKSLSNDLIKRHLETCVMKQIKDDHLEVIDEIVMLFKRFQ